MTFYECCSPFLHDDLGTDAETAGAAKAECQEDVDGGGQPEGEVVQGRVAEVFRRLVRSVELAVGTVNPDIA